MKTTGDTIRDFVRRGQAAQKAVDAAIVAVPSTEHPELEGLPPWKQCAAADCRRWTRGVFCPLHYGTDFSTGPAEQGAPGQQQKEPPRGEVVALNGGGALSARGRSAGRSNTGARKGRKRNAR